MIVYDFFKDIYVYIGQTNFLLTYAFGKSTIDVVQISSNAELRPDEESAWEICISGDF